ncbi:RNA-guided endonuclease TnpB family protein [Nocardia sp. MH4]|uniref:RNA-guided endonuclease TnpB family protein n=1 Tax=Nocardia sp. MH4 TaxID=1768677 RepID=UPI001C4F6A70|nr:RNA-guided endonuclease TnpB family protein [Nocardia sp. MH4]
MIRAFVFALDPTDAQADAMRSHCGAQRLAFNWCLARVLANWSQRRAEESYGLAPDALTPWISASAYSLRKAWNAAKGEVAPWWAENSKEAYASGGANLATALKNYSAGLTRLPRFKSKHRTRPTCRFTTGAFGLGSDRRHIKLPVIGTVRTHESTRKLARKVACGSARIRSATLSFGRGRWSVSFSVELRDPAPRSRAGNRTVGVDLGIKSLAVLSTGEQVPNPRHLDRMQTSLRRVQRQIARRQGPDRRGGLMPSRRWTKAHARADTLHARVANRRRDTQQKLTTRLVAEFDTIVIRHVPDAARRKPSSPCPNAAMSARPAVTPSTGTSTPRETSPR